MAGISLSGLGTGIDTATMIKQLVALEGRRYNSYSTQKQNITSKLDSINYLDSKLAALKAAASDLSTVQKLSGFKVSSSDTDIITATASSSAYEGSHTIKVGQLATADRLVHTAGYTYAEDYVGQGAFIYSYNNVESVLTTTDTTTLEELAGLINNDANNPGVTASLLYYGDTYHLVLNGNDAGSDYSIKINASNTEVWKASSALATETDNATLTTKLTSLAGFTGNPTAPGTIDIQGKMNDADGTAVNVSFAVTASSKVSHLLDAIENAFGNTVVASLDNGVIKVTDKTSGTSKLEVSLSSSTFTLPTMSRSVQGGSIAQNPASDFVAANFTETQLAQDSWVKVDGYPQDTVNGDGSTTENWITRSSNTISDVIPGVTIDLQSIGQASVTTTRDSSSLKAKVQKFVDAYNAVAQYIKDNSGYDTATKTAGILMGDGTTSTVRDSIRTPLTTRTPGFLQSADGFVIPSNIGLSFDKDGVLSLDSETFDEAISKDYSAVQELIGADKAGTSDSNYVRFYGASSKYTTAGTYDVQVTVEAGAITGARIKLATETSWRNAAWSGNMVSGDLTFDSQGRPTHPENGLQLAVDLSQSGTTSTKVRIKEGFAGSVTTNIANLLKGTTGAVKMQEKYLKDRISALQTRMDNEQKRLDTYEQRLKEKFARMEKALTLLQQQFGGLTQS
jgi:flagellar hook-associated protein 2